MVHSQARLRSSWLSVHLRRNAITEQTQPSHWNWKVIFYDRSFRTWCYITSPSAPERPIEFFDLMRAPWVKSKIKRLVVAENGLYLASLSWQNICRAWDNLCKSRDAILCSFVVIYAHNHPNKTVETQERRSLKMSRMSLAQRYSTNQDTLYFA